MKVAYLDSSVIIALLLEEGPSKQIRKTLTSFKKLYSASLLEAEVLATAKRENIDLSFAYSFISPIGLLFSEQSLQKEYEEIFSLGYCRGADAYHLASALFLDPEKSNLFFFTLDEKQKLIAKKMGFKIVET